MRWAWSVLAVGIVFGFVIGYQFARWQKATSPFDINSPALASVQKPKSLIEGFTQVAKAAEKAVVHIATTAPVPEEYRMFREFFFGEKLPERVPYNYGSGFFFRRDGYILTNYHVVRRADTIKVGLDEQTELPAELIGYDPLLDVAVLKVKANQKKFTALPLGDSEKLEKCEWVIAVGNPFGLDKTVTVGVVSAKGREFEELNGRPAITSYIQTDAAINPGNSGGPLLNLNGEVVGINTFIIGQQGNIGIGFALPINEVKKILERLVKGERITRGVLGISMIDANSPQAEELGIQAKEGVVIVEMPIRSPAYQAGLRPGDVIVKFKGVAVKNVSHLRRLVLQQAGGATVTVEVLRGGKRQEFTVKLGSR